MSTHQPHIPEGAHSEVTTSTDNPSEFLRSCDQRAEKLRRYMATVTGTTDISVLLSSKTRTADVRPHPNGSGYLVRVTTQAIPQPATDFERDVFDRAAQHGLALHEAGHILYTDFDVLYAHLKDAIEGKPPKIQEFGKSVFNTFEDGVVEQNIREDFTEIAAKRLRVVNRNLRQQRLQSLSDTDQQNLTAPDAVQTALLDICVADSGITDRLTDEENDDWAFVDPANERLYFAVLPIIRDTHIKTLTAPDTETRAKHMANCWEIIEATLFDDHAPEESNSQSQAGQAGQQDADGPKADQNDRDGQESQTGDSSPSGADGSSSPEDSSSNSQADGSNNQEIDAESAPEEGGSTAGSEDSSDVSDIQLSPDQAAPDEEFRSPLSEVIEENATGETADPDTRDDMDETPSCSQSEVADQQEDIINDADSQPTVPGDEAPESDHPTDDAGEPAEADEVESQPSEETATESEDASGDNSNETESQPNSPETDSQTTFSDFNSGESDDSDNEGTDATAEHDDSYAGPDSEATESSGDEKAGSERDSSHTSAGSSPDSSDQGEAESGDGDPGDAGGDEMGDESFADREAENLKSERRAIEEQANREQKAASRANAALEDEDEDVTVCPDVHGSFDVARWDAASRKSELLAQAFAQRLKQSDNDSQQRGTTAGTPVSSLLYNTSTGNPKFMGRRSPGDNKRHCFVIILDRSASMASSNQEKSPVERAEKGVIQAALALERCGIDICIIDFYRTSVRVLNPFGQPISEAKHRLTTAEAAGLTPLGKALSVAKSQLKTVRGPGHIIAMTDDDPTDRSRFEAESETCRYPIHGGLITMAGAGTTNTRTPNELYDTHVSITGSDDLSNKLLHLAERLALR